MSRRLTKTIHLINTETFSIICHSSQQINYTVIGFSSENYSIMTAAHAAFSTMPSHYFIRFQRDLHRKQQKEKRKKKTNIDTLNSQCT